MVIGHSPLWDSFGPTFYTPISSNNWFILNVTEDICKTNQDSFINEKQAT